ncbi:MAG: SusC/RagA family TonB-linked outer membrane protein, partial [Bacteroidota bacterium]|nr:SusC/RagA family TonB-linked outer membrane protein [Bacteroidota bacterium]
MKKQSPIFKKALFLFMALSFIGMSWAQTKSISGTVKNATGEPVVGATVTVKGTTIGTVTDANGVFNLNAPAQAKTLEFTSIGFQKEEVEIKGAVIDVVLRESSKMLDEVIVIGYGTVKKSDLTGSVSSMNSGDVVQKGTLNVVSAIQGSVAGVQIQQSSSRAGASYNITVRGQNSVSGTTTPLYVVDGVITSNIDFLNPQDIEKIDVLKDASSTAIYGSRGSHGVVIVQTRSGKSVQGISKPVISYNGYYGISKITRMPDFMDTREWMKYRILNYQYTSDANNDGVIEIATSDLKNVWMGGIQLRDLNDGKGLQPVYADGTFGGSKWLLDRYLANTSTDWVGLVTQKGVQENHYIDISGSTRDIAYVVGVGYQNEKGVFVNDSYQRYNLKGSVNANLSDKWSTGFNISTGYSTQETGSDNAMLSAFRMSPIVAAYTNGNLDPALNHLIGDVIVVPGKTTETLKDANGNAIFPNSIGSGGFTSSINPLIDLASTSNNTKKIVALGSAYLQFIPFKNLILKTTISPSITSYRTGLYKSTLAEGNYDNPLTTAVENDAKANVENFTYYNYTWDNQVNYKFTLNNDHNFDLMGLFSLYSENSEDYNTNTAGYNYNYEWYNLGTATNTANTKLTSYYSEASMVSYAARANYSYKGKYLATASIREDGSSKLAEGHKWASFPSASVAWRVSEESFMESFKNILSNLKFRLSLGYTGNNNINPFLTQLLANKSTYYNFGSTDALGVGIGSLVSQELTWEKTREFNLGIDMGFLNNRIDMTVDLYNRLSTGLLQNRTLPLESGGGTMT